MSETTLLESRVDKIERDNRRLKLTVGALLLVMAGAACVGEDEQRIVAFGDVHGDLEAARGALRLAGAIDEQDRWIGGDLIVVQTGDQLDRGDQEQAILPGNIQTVICSSDECFQQVAESPIRIVRSVSQFSKETSHFATELNS